MTSQDYRNRNKTRKRASQSSDGAFKWMLITGLSIGLVVFMVYLQGIGSKKIRHHLQQHPITASLAQAVKTQSDESLISGELPNETAAKLEQQPDVILPPEAADELEKDAPQFDFYTTLPKKDVAVSDYEVLAHSIVHEEKSPVVTVTTAPMDSAPVSSTVDDNQEQPRINATAGYMMQAGSFKNMSDAEKMRANLESMGIESRIERAKVGEVIWHRIKIGPYTQMSSVSTIRARLHQNGIDVIVTETGMR